MTNKITQSMLAMVLIVKLRKRVSYFSEKLREWAEPTSAIFPKNNDRVSGILH